MILLRPELRKMETFFLFYAIAHVVGSSKIKTRINEQKKVYELQIKYLHCLTRIRCKVNSKKILQLLIFFFSTDNNRNSKD